MLIFDLNSLFISQDIITLERVSCRGEMFIEGRRKAVVYK